MSIFTYLTDRSKLARGSVPQEGVLLPRRRRQRPRHPARESPGCVSVGSHSLWGGHRAARTGRPARHAPRAAAAGSRARRRSPRPIPRRSTQVAAGGGRVPPRLLARLGLPTTIVALSPIAVLLTPHHRLTGNEIAGSIPRPRASYQDRCAMLRESFVYRCSL
jgi:hypothetical protein